MREKLKQKKQFMSPIYAPNVKEARRLNGARPLGYSVSLLLLPLPAPVQKYSPLQDRTTLVEVLLPNRLPRSYLHPGSVSKNLDTPLRTDQVALEHKG